MLELDLETEKNLNKDIIFDRAAESAGSLIAGGYYLVKPTTSAKNFFRRLSNDLEWWYAPGSSKISNTFSIFRQHLHDFVVC